LLAERPMSGYDLAKCFDESLAQVWSAGHSQIYPELARLKAAGLIEDADDEPGSRGRKVYRVTGEGVAEVRRWLLETEPDPNPRNEARLRMFFLWVLDPNDVRAYIRRQGEIHRETLARYEAVARTVVPKSPAQRAARVALHAGIRQERAMAEWADWAVPKVSWIFRGKRGLFERWPEDPAASRELLEPRMQARVLV
jgi:PadR family transcriptional regulator, regulatory protein AphA